MDLLTSSGRKERERQRVAMLSDAEREREREKRKKREWKNGSSMWTSHSEIWAPSRRRQLSR